MIPSIDTHNRRLVWKDPPLRKRNGGGNPDFGPIFAYVERLIEGVLSFYTNPRSEAVDCPELRQRINDEMADIIPRTVKHFDLEPIDLVLRVRAVPGHPELLKVRAEKPNLC